MLFSMSSALFAMVGLTDAGPHMQTKLLCPGEKKTGSEITLITVNGHDEGVSAARVTPIEVVNIGRSLQLCELKPASL